MTLKLNLGWSVYSFRGLVAEQRFFPVPMLLLRGLGEPQREENRRAPRASVFIKPMETHILGDGWLPIDVVIMNISTAGVLIRHAEPLSQGSMVRMHFQLPGDFDAVAATSQVMRAEVKQTEGGTIHQTGTRFVSLDDDDEDTIFKFVFDQQVEMRRKGLMGR